LEGELRAEAKEEGLSTRMDRIDRIGLIHNWPHKRHGECQPERKKPA
jgi:hypothetical protein